MSKQGGTSSRNSRVSEKRKLVRDKFALLAMVGRVKKEVSQLQDEADFYSTIATDLVALSEDQLELLQQIEKQADSDQMTDLVIDLTSQFHHLIRRLLSFYPQRTKSQERYSRMLGSDGLARVLADTPDGYVSLSTDQILENVERVIDLTKRELARKQSSNSEVETV